MVVGQILVPTQARADLPAVHLAAAGDFDDEVATGTPTVLWGCLVIT